MRSVQTWIFLPSFIEHFRIDCSGKLGTGVGCELFVALCFVGLLHLVKRFVDERTSRIEHPLTFRASEALKILALNPDQFALQLPNHSRNKQSETGTV